MPTAKIERSLSIRGWMNNDELQWLGDRAAEHQSIVEIGCWMGRTTCTLAENTPGVVHAVDTWRGSPEIDHLTREHAPEWLLNEFMRCVGDLVASGKIVVFQGKSIEVAGSVVGILCPNMIFIDGLHDYDNVIADILAWRPLLAPGGLLCGHDFADGFPGVQRAVREVCSGFERGPGSIWYMP